MPIRSRLDPLAFPGAAALLHIRDRLWSTGQIGRAAVLVGAGFSRNATRLTPNALPFPVWWELRDALAQRLNMSPKVVSDLSAMRLGSLVEASFGRSALDSVLQDTIPWQQYTPGSAHEKLLRLPWADVFTTNYDTLLEDARGQVVDRAYSLVLNAGDLPDRPQPRIVKLHGSFPSERPYLFTEEDFRAYPRSSAPFVNLVQGSMMENVMCLIGFSGEDPNFIAWSGWVRDNLGDHAPNIYLCGVLDINDAQRRYLEARRVTTVDLGPLFPVTSWPDPAERHHAATEWLLDSLQAGELEDVSRWPSPADQPRPQTDDLRIPSVLPSPSRESGYPYTEGEISAWHLSWERAFRTYPGWELLGRDGRNLLKELIFLADDDVFLPEEVLEAPMDLLAASTVVRRAHLTALPISALTAERLAKVVDAYYPFGLPDGQHGHSPEGPELTVPAEWSATTAVHSFNWADAGQRWMEMILALMSHARVSGEESEFMAWSERARPFLDRQQQWLAQWHHEQVLFALGQHDLRRARRAIEGWPEATTAPFWETRRAALHAELGNTTEAWRVALRALDAIRKRLVAARTDPTLQSQEQWTITLLHRLTWADNLEEYGQKDLALRQRNLQGRRGFNDDDLQDLAKTVQSFPLSTGLQTFKWGFDPEEVIYSPHSDQTWKWSSDHEHTRIATALSLLDVLDRVACPPRMISTSVANGVRHAAYLVWPSAPARAIGMLIRLGGDPTEHIRTLMTREAVVHLNEAAVNLIFKIYSTAFREAQDSMSAPQAEHTRIRRFVPPLRESAEVLSRLSFRLSALQTEQLMGLATSCYLSLALRREVQRSEVSHLFKRLLEAMTPAERASWLPFLVALPLVGELGMELEDSRLSHYPEPIGHLTLPKAFDRSSLTTDPGVQRSIDLLIKKVEESQELIRSGAAHRLLQLMRLNLLSQTQLDDFWQALNTRRTVDGLPADVYHAAVLMLHAPEGHQAEARLTLQRSLRRLAFGEGQSGQLFTDLDLSPGEEFIQLGRVILLQLSHSETPEWTAEDTRRLSERVTERCREYWRAPEMLPAWPWEWNPALVSIWTLAIVLPLHQEIQAPSASDPAVVLTRLVQQAISMHVPVGLVVPRLMQIGSWTHDQGLNWIRQALGSNEPRRIMDVVHAMHEWATPSFASGISDDHPLIWTIRELCSRVRVRHPVALEGVLRALADVMSIGGTLAAAVNTADLIEGLVYLLEETSPTAELRQESGDNLVLRYRASVLAAQLTKNIPGLPGNWQSVYSSDPLPEVREPWYEVAGVSIC